MIVMKAKCYCPKHGKLKFEDIIIKDYTPLCAKCHSVLEFCDIRPRFNVNGGTKRSRKKKKRK